MQLPDAAVALLESASATDAKPIDQLAAETDEKPETLTGAAFDLETESLLDIEERTTESLALTEEGTRYRADGLPELRLYRAAVDAGATDDPVSMGQVIGRADLDGPAVDIALSNFARKGLGSIESGELSVNPDADPDSDAEAAALDVIATASDSAGALDDVTADRLVERGLVERHEQTERLVALTDDGVTALMEGVETAETVGQLTPELLTSGEWEEVTFADYNVEADAEPVTGGKTHVLRQTAESVKDTLVGMGFQEMQGPHADADFWINDALFMPQDHPARTHWDRFTLDTDPMTDLPDDLVDRVEDAHRNGVGPDGEGYHSPWSRAFAEEVALRGHTTSLSMRYLSGEALGELDPPQRFFSVEKVYRNDTLDATHLLEFFQIEGWVMAEDLSVRDLMGTFEEFYAQFGITDIEFKPHYNPYTEPSFELFGTHPTTGETVEIGNSGLFREEVLSPLGVDCDVIAWGLALERLLMLMYGFEDIRDVHGTLTDLEFLRNAEVVY